MLLIYGDETLLNQAEREACYAESIQYTHDLQANGHFVAASPLQLTSTAASVKVRDGQVVVTDGPFAETHEQLGGYFMVDAKDREEAIELAKKIPGAKFGTVEVRPIVELTGLPEK
jgi:hypothetical protein